MDFLTRCSACFLYSYRKPAISGALVLLIKLNFKRETGTYKEIHLDLSDQHGISVNNLIKIKMCSQATAYHVQWMNKVNEHLCKKHDTRKRIKIIRMFKMHCFV